MYGGLGFLYIIWFCTIAIPKGIAYLILKSMNPEMSEKELDSSASAWATLSIFLIVFLMILAGGK